ncbi:SDR family oxidoreductase [Chryseosolibacter indicus]|uniref:SDR family oxidoreductase n=1 Tax=Chryseosolibacter indicus TaxID=2782351 RepID=A0ABS5VMA7_9BACT|nr:SDR family oxidoreductase [Chryseosolibacter indicus]MBT1702585.1 SDR family oxidoreductase [Chryseosolibacter indicus]
MSKNALILGATSDMALAIARKFGTQGYTLTLAARNLEKLQVIKADIEIRQRAKVEIARFDAMEIANHQEFYNQLPVKPDIVFCVFGFLGDQTKAQYDWKMCEEILVSNYVGAVSILNIIANDMEARKQGTIVGISSVAGERGRQSNYIYGSAKAGFTAYLSGLRNRLCKSGVHVLTVKPGFVKTRMLDGMKTPGPLTAQPQEVAEDIYNAVANKKNTIYTRGVWRLVMYTIKSIPEPIFKKMKL